MILPNLCSFVGVDERTDMTALRAVANGSSFNTEWGVLYSPERAGNQPRYPTYKFIKQFLNSSRSPTGNLTSLHLCGQAIDKFLDGDEDLDALIQEFDPRVQLNFSMNKFEENYLLFRLTELVQKYRYRLILQWNKSKAEFTKKLIQSVESHSNIPGMFDILYDGSGGFGKVLDKFKPTIDWYYTGYAGGIGPDTVRDITLGIGKVAKDSYYIDMESGIRTDDWFDLKKCEDVLGVINTLSNAEVFD